jgi:nucleoid-associated protein YgaU
VTNGEAPDTPSPTPRLRSKTWLIAGGLLVLAAVAIGSVLGVSLATREGGPLASQRSANGRPTILVGSAVATPSVVPSPSAATRATPAAAPAEASTEYVVQPGDTLRTIAEQQYGDGDVWPRIYQANRDVIGPDPDALRAGTKLQLPPP